MREQKKKKEYLKGYFTVEASMLVSVILCILVFIIYLTFFLYDRAILTGAAYQAALAGSRMYDKTREEIEAEVEELTDAIVEGKLLACSYETEVSVSFIKVTVTYHLHVNAPFSKLMERMLTGFDADYQVTKSASKISGVTFIQGCQNIEQIANLIKKGEE